MASRQTSYYNLAPIEQKQQDQWAFEKLKTGAGAYLDGYGWERRAICQNTGVITGYICVGEAHFVTDASVAAGDGLVLLRMLYPDDLNSMAYEKWYGPYTPERYYAEMTTTKKEHESHSERNRSVVACHTRK